MSGKAWDKVVLLLVGLLVAAVSVLFSLRALGFSENFSLVEAKPVNDLPETKENIAAIAQSYVEKKQEWANSNKGVNGTEVPLFISVPLVEKDGMVINMLDPNAAPLRPPVENSWLLKYNLDFLNAGVLSQDPDGDGFTSQVEWESKTDPIDEASHPPYANKLIFASRQQEVYILRFAAKPDPERFQVNRLPSAKWPRGENFYIRIGEVSKDEQFRLDSYEEKRAKNNVGIEVDASVLKITYLPKNETHELIRNVDTQIPTYYAEMQFSLDSSFKQYVKEGETFSLTIDPDTKYRVTKVNENSVIITYQTGTDPEQTVEIPKK